MAASLPLLLMLIHHGSKVGTMEIVLINQFSGNLRGLALLVVLGAFLVKLPIYGVHLWLPKAHVEAPLAGSIILAGILLKLGGFGIYQMKYRLNMCVDRFSLVIVCLRI